MMVKAIKNHFHDGQRRLKESVFEITDSDMAKSLIAQKCVEEVIGMGCGKKGHKGGKKK